MLFGFLFILRDHRGGAASFILFFDNSIVLCIKRKPKIKKKLDKANVCALKYGERVVTILFLPERHYECASDQIYKSELLGGADGFLLKHKKPVKGSCLGHGTANTFS